MCQLPEEKARVEERDTEPVFFILLTCCPEEQPIPDPGIYKKEIPREASFPFLLYRNLI